MRPMNPAKPPVESAVVGVAGAARRAQLSATWQVIDLLAEGIGNLGGEPLSEAPVQSDLQGMISRIPEIARVAGDATVLREWLEHIRNRPLVATERHRASSLVRPRS